MTRTKPWSSTGSAWNRISSSAGAIGRRVLAEPSRAWSISACWSVERGIVVVLGWPRTLWAEGSADHGEILAGQRCLQKSLSNAYIGRVGRPTMAINAAWHKRIGPGGGTRRLHQWGRNRIDERGKGAVFARYGSAATGHTQVPTIMTLHSLLPPKQRT